ncbi:hypothetical protein FHS99_003505 [Sphingomonas prati]|uniref:DUF5681 domain-containing protein n=1 Tax=Sphingomonas prati TaxID=1843237 RepID=A0A7W9F312_9SPHN|nr:hypothetical protein [Sphingomonas prati]
MTITSDGKQRRVRKRRIIIKALAAKAAKGNVAAADRLIALIIQAEGLEDQRTVAKPMSENDRLIMSRFLENEDAEGANPALLLNDEDPTHD